MSAEDIGEVVAGLKVQMEMMIGILKDIQKDMKLNYMPTAQIEDRFKSQGERIGTVEKSYTESVTRIEGTMKTMDQDVKDKFTALATAMENKFISLATAAEKQSDKKSESPFKIIAALGGLVVIIGGVVGGVIWLIHLVK